MFKILLLSEPEYYKLSQLALAEYNIIWTLSFIQFRVQLEHNVKLS